MNKYFWALERMIADVQQPGFYPLITAQELLELRCKYYSLYPEDSDTEPDANQERVLTVPLTKLIAKRLGSQFSTPDDNSYIQGEDGCSLHFLWYLEDKYWLNLARTERKCLVRNIPLVLSRFRRFPLYEKNLWRVIFAYADVPVRFR